MILPSRAEYDPDGEPTLLVWVVHCDRYDATVIFRPSGTTVEFWKNGEVERKEDDEGKKLARTLGRIHDLQFHRRRLRLPIQYLVKKEASV